MEWSKEADWLPLSNAIAMVDFWNEDLRQSQKYLDTVLMYQQRYNMTFPNAIKIARDDVEVSKKGLNDAIQKLIETRERIDQKG